MSGHAVILGAGQIGIACAEEFLASGWSVDLLSRTPSAAAPHGVHQRPLDRHDDAALLDAAGSGGDLLIDTIAFDRRDADQLVFLAERFGAVAAMSSAAVYCDFEGCTLDEAAEKGFPTGMAGLAVGDATTVPGDGSYSARKVAMEQRLLSGAPRKAIIVRPCAIHGPHSRHPREWWFVKRMLDGRRRIPLAYRGESRFQTTSVDAIARLIGDVVASGGWGIFNCADQDAPTVLEIGQTIAAHLGVSPEFVGIDGVSDTVGRTPWTIPNPITLANPPGATFAGSYAGEVVPALDWLTRAQPADWRAAFPTLAAYPWNLFDYAAEDAALGA